LFSPEFDVSEEIVNGLDIVTFLEIVDSIIVEPFKVPAFNEERS